MTLQLLARDVGVSRATVSNAYNHPEQLSAALRVRILERAAELGFPGPNPLARGLRRRRIGAVGVIFGEPLSYAFADPAAAVILDGLAQALQTDRIALLLLAAGHPAPSETPGLDAQKVTDAAVDGWVVYSTEEGHPFVQAALARHEPVVILDQPSSLGAPRVEVDSAEGTRLATAHLLGLGHRDLVVLSLPFAGDGRSGLADVRRQDHGTFELTRRRLAGARSAVAESGSPGIELTVVECAHNDPASAAAAVTPFLEQGPGAPPTAVVAMSDQLAFGAIRAARALGLAVPGDLSVVGFDDVAGAAGSEPPLTTVRQPLEERGRLAGTLILDLLHERPVAAVTTLPVELVVRSSTAPPKAGRP
ncbi:MAG: transcriptional regulator [Acidimicrobiaceae bacterium]|nr:transcriptional regulator [Acidimicrobiaceae bacterium]